MKLQHLLLAASALTVASIATPPAHAQFNLPSNPFGKKESQNEQSTGSSGIGGAAGDVVLGELACRASKNKGLLAAAAQDMMPGTGIIDTGILDGAINAIGDRFSQNASPYCHVETSVGALLLTAALIDDATLSAAIAVDKAQEALGMQRSLVNDINALRQNQGLGNPMASIDDEGMNRSKRVGDAAVAAAAGLKAMELTGWQTPEMEAAAQALAENLSSSTWLQVQVMAGVKTSTDLIGELNQQGKQDLLVDPNVGLTSEFVQMAPGRFQDSIKNISKIGFVNQALNQVTDKKLLKKIEKSEKKGVKDTKKDAKALGKSADEFVYSMQ